MANERRRAIRLILCGAILFAPAMAADMDRQPDGKTVLVEVNGAKLTLADLEQKNATALFQARTNYYEAERKAIEGLVDTYLLEQQAAKEGVTVAELLDKHVTASIPKDPPEDALRVYYEGLDTTTPYESVRDKILDALRQRRIAKAKVSYLESLHSHASVVIRMAPPRAPISMKDVPVRGPANAPVLLMEYADYECPYCQQSAPVVEKLEAEFKGKLAFAFKDFPLNMHPDAQKAAEASHCAGAQGKYWEFHDALFANRALAPAALKSQARDLKLDPKAFDACLDSGAMAGLVKDQGSEAMTLGFQGTPTFLVNGRYINGAITYERLRAVITEELSATAGPATASANGAALSKSPGQVHVP